MSLKYVFKSFCPRYTRKLKNNSFWTVDIIFIEKLQISRRIYFNVLTESDEWEEKELSSFKKQNNRKQFSC